MQVLAHRVKGTDSPFSLYISNLPVGVSGVPMFFPRAALNALEYAPATHQVRMRCQWLLNFAQGALQPLPETPDDPFAGSVIDANALGTGLSSYQWSDTPLLSISSTLELNTQPEIRFRAA